MAQSTRSIKSMHTVRSVKSIKSMRSLKSNASGKDENDDSSTFEQALPKALQKYDCFYPVLVKREVQQGT